MFRVVSTDSKTRDLLPEAFAWGRLDADVTIVDAETEAELIDSAAEADALVVDASTPVTERVLRETPVRVVGRTGVGVDNIDLDAAAGYDVPVVNVPDYCIDEVATHAMALALSTWRRLRPYDEHVRAGGWSRDAGTPAYRLAGETVGLVAFGRIGRRLADLFAGFDVDLVAYDPYLDDATVHSHGARPVDIEALLQESAVVSVHAPLTSETTGLLGRTAFRLMRGDAVLVNTARGGIVDNDALGEALNAGRIAGAGLDVLPAEPPAALPSDHPNLVVTPHVGWYSEAALEECARSIAEDVGRVLRGEEPANPVEDPW